MVVAEEKKVGIWEKLGDIDRRWIYLISFIMLAEPLIYPINLPIAISPETARIFNYINQLPKGSIIALSMDFDYPTGENYPQARSAFAQALKAGMKVIIMGTWIYGATVSASLMIDEIKAYAQQKGITQITSAMATYGENYVSLGMITGASTGVMQMAQVGFYPLLFPKDVYGNPLDTLPFNKFGKPITQFTAADVDVLISFSAGAPGIGDYQNYWWATGIMTHIAVGAIGVMLSGYYSSMDAGIIIGIIPSTRGAMEYDQLGGLIGASGQSLGTMDAQSLQHLFIAILLVMGNVGYIATRRRRRVV